MQMIEKVAEAIRSVEIVLPGAGGLRGKLRLAPAISREMARAAIKAMREPTTHMLERGSDEFGKPKKTLPRYWRAMIDAALNEESNK
jgi:hypothetical protein